MKKILFFFGSLVVLSSYLRCHDMGNTSSLQPPTEEYFSIRYWSADSVRRDSIRSATISRIEAIQAFTRNDKVGRVVRIDTASRLIGGFDWESDFPDNECPGAGMRDFWIGYILDEKEAKVWESVSYVSGRSFPIMVADFGLIPADPQCESLVIDYDYVHKEYECHLYTLEPRFEYAIDMLDAFPLEIPQADSVLASWGLSRQWPIEEWEAEYR